MQHEPVRAKPRFTDPAHTDLDDLMQDITAARHQLLVAEARYRRKALWLKADELRKELARVEAQAARITIDNPEGNDA